MSIQKRLIGLVIILCIILTQWGIAHSAPVSIRVGWVIPSETAKYVMMKRPHILKHYGKVYTVEWFQFAGTSQIATALAAGGLDAGCLASLSLGKAVDEFNLDVKITAGTMMEVSPDFTTTWLVIDGSGINHVRELKGKRIGVNAYGAGVDHIARATLRKAGLDPDKDVKILEISFGLQEAALRKGDIDCGVFPQPFYQKAIEKGGVKPLFRLGDIQPKFVQLFEVFTTQFIRKDPEAVKAYLADWKIASKYIYDHREDVRKVTSEVTKLPVELLNKFLLTKDDYHYPPTGEPDFDTIQKNWDFLYETAKAISKKLDVKKYYLPEFLPSAGP